MKRSIAAGLAALMLLGLTGCGFRTESADEAREVIQVIAMDTVMIFSTYGENSTHADYLAEDEVRRLEDELSRTEEGSAVYQLNHADGASVEVGGEVCALIRAAEAYRKATSGAFDISIAPVVSAWGFTEEENRVPPQAELDALLEKMGDGMVRVEDGGAVTLAPGAAIDLGGIAKGYASDRIAMILRDNAIPRATISLGGNVLAWGSRPDGTPWRVGIQDPREPDNANAFAGLLQLTDAYAVTSGGYQRFFEADGRTYHHIIDPATGYPADSGLTSVTVVTACDRDGADGTPGPGTMCDALSTALFVMGEEKALTFWRSGAYDFDLVLVTADGRVVVTDGLTDAFEESGESGYRYEIVS